MFWPPYTSAREREFENEPEANYKTLANPASMRSWVNDERLKLNTSLDISGNRNIVNVGDPLSIDILSAQWTKSWPNGDVGGLLSCCIGV